MPIIRILNEGIKTLLELTQDLSLNVISNIKTELTKILSSKYGNANYGRF